MTRTRIIAVVTAALLIGAAPLADSVASAQAPVTAISPTLRGQILLDRLGFSPGEIDGRSGSNLRRAVEAYQRAHQLATSGTLDDATMMSLDQSAGAGPVLVAYQIIESDLAGPFAPSIPADLVEQSKLPSLDYRTPLEALAERFHCSPSLLMQLNPEATFAQAGEQILVPDVTSAAPADPAAANAGAGLTIVVRKATSALTVEDANGHVVFHAPVTTGSEHDPLPIGTWKVTGVRRMPEFFYNPALFWDADRSHSKARLAPGPNNPVGVVWIDLSKPHYGIHGTPEPSRIGHVQSHGCVRLTNWDAQRVAQWARPGMKVVFE